MAASNNSLLKVNNDQQLFFNCLTLVGTNKFQEIFNIKNVFKKAFMNSEIIVDELVVCATILIIYVNTLAIT